MLKKPEFILKIPAFLDVGIYVILPLLLLE